MTVVNVSSLPPTANGCLWKGRCARCVDWCSRAIVSPAYSADQSSATPSINQGGAPRGSKGARGSQKARPPSVWLVTQAVSPIFFVSLSAEPTYCPSGRTGRVPYGILHWIQHLQVTALPDMDRCSCPLHQGERSVQPPP